MSKNHPRHYIDHAWRNKKPLGYCHCRLHKGYLDCKLLKKHECLNKQCTFLEKYLEHPYWAQRDFQKQIKKSKRLEFKQKLNSLQSEVIE